MNSHYHKILKACFDASVYIMCLIQVTMQFNKLCASTFKSVYMDRG